MNYENLEHEFEIYSAMITIQETFQEIYEIMNVDVGEIGRKIVSVIDATKKLTDIAIATKNVELRESTVELRDQLVDIKKSLVKVKEENFELREEIKKLKLQRSYRSRINRAHVIIRRHVVNDKPHGKNKFKLYQILKMIRKFIFIFFIFFN